MNLIQIVVTLAIVGVLLWLVLTYIPMPAPFKTIITAVAVIAVVLWLLQVTGLLGYADIHLSRVR